MEYKADDLKRIVISDLEVDIQVEEYGVLLSFVGDNYQQIGEVHRVEVRLSFVEFIHLADQFVAASILFAPLGTTPNDPT